MKVGDEEVQVLMSFPVLHAGWELDYEAHLVKDGAGKLRLVGTDHGRKYFVKPKELEEKLKEYRDVLGKTKTALRSVYRQEEP